MTGCSTVFHVAGVNAMCLRDPSEMLRVNVGGSLNVLEAAASAGVSKVVYTSSAATIGEAPGTVGTEETHHRGWFLSEYEESKVEAEKAVIDRAGSLGLDVVIVNPSSVQGPGRSTGSAKIVLAALNARVVPRVDVNLSIVDIDDCADAHLRAERLGRPGERYLVSGATITLSEALEHIRAITGGRHVSLPVPRSILQAAIGPMRLVERVRTSEAFCAELVATLLHGHIFDATKSQTELGMEYRTPRHLFGRLIQWYADYGFIQRSLPNIRKNR